MPDEDRPSKKLKPNGGIFGFFRSSLITTQNSPVASSPRRAILPPTNSLAVASTDPPPPVPAAANHEVITTAMTTTNPDSTSKKRRRSIIFTKSQETGLVVAAPSASAKRTRRPTQQIEQFRQELNRRNHPEEIKLPSNRTPGTIRSVRRRVLPMPPPGNLQDQMQHRIVGASASVQSPPSQRETTVSSSSSLRESLEALDHAPHQVQQEEDIAQQTLEIPPLNPSRAGPHIRYHAPGIFQPDPPLTLEAFEKSQERLLAYQSTRQTKIVFTTDDDMEQAPAAAAQQTKSLWDQKLEEHLTQWQCPVCCSKNPLNGLKCVSCEADRPDAKPAAAKTVAPAAPGGISASGFSFPAAAAGAASNSGTTTFGGFSTGTTAPAPIGGGFSFQSPAATEAAKPTDEPSKPTFAFGAPAAKETPKPGFTFGAPAATAPKKSKEETSANKASKPSFGQPATSSKDSKPSLSFGGTPSNDKDSKPMFSFGAPPPDKTDDSKAASSFGASNAKEEESKTSATFGDGAAKRSIPTFSFGAPAASQDEKPASTFGVSAAKDGDSTADPKSSLKFGSSVNDQGSNSLASPSAPATQLGGRKRGDSSMSIGSDSAGGNNDAPKDSAKASGQFSFSSTPVSQPGPSANGSVQTDGNTSTKPVVPAFGASQSVKSDGPSAPAFGSGGSSGFGNATTAFGTGASSSFGNAQVGGSDTTAVDESKKRNEEGFATSAVPAMAGMGSQSSTKKLEDATGISSANASTAFGSSNGSNPFGSNAASNGQDAAFGSNTTSSSTSNPFGGSGAVSSGQGGSTFSASGGFGGSMSGSTSTATNAFGSGSAAFGSQNNGGTMSSSSGFGGNASSNFGAPSSSGFSFGSSAPKNDGFGAAAAPTTGGFGTFGGSGGFGSTSGTPATMTGGFGGPVVPARDTMGATSAFPQTQAPSAFPQPQASAFPTPTFPTPGTQAFGNSSGAAFPGPQFGGAAGQPPQQFGNSQQATSFAPSGSANPPSFGQPNGALGGTMNGAPNFGGNVNQQASFTMGKTPVPGRRVVKARRPKR